MKVTQQKDTNERIIVIDDEKPVCESCRKVLSRQNYHVETFNDGKKALERISEEYFDIVITDLKMAHIDGMTVLKKARAISPETDVIMISGYATVDSAIESMKSGAYDYITKPFASDTLIMKVGKCIEKRRLSMQVCNLKEIVGLYELSQAMSSSIGLGELLEIILTISCNTINVDSGSIMLYEEKSQHLKVHTIKGIDLRSAEYIRNRIEEIYPGWIHLNNELMLPSEVLGNVSHPGIFSLLPQIKCALCVPLKVNDMTIGIINLNILSSLKHFTKKDVELLEIFATNAALSIRDAQAYERVRELDRLKSEFVSNVSHELKTPLMTINASVDLLESDLFQNMEISKARELLTICSRNIRKMSKIVNDIMIISEVDAGWLKVNKEKISPLILANIATNLMKERAQEKDIILNCDVVEAIPDIEVDVEMMREALLNMIDNAIKFTPQGGKINVQAEMGEDDNLMIKISDSGIGIPEEEQERIFDKFYQIDSSISRAYGGCGLGLAIVDSIIKQHNGRIWVESQEGQGSRFIISLPQSDYAEDSQKIAV